MTGREPPGGAEGDAQAPAAPQDHGQRLATFPRGPDAELRVSLSEFEGRPYVSLRVWERASEGAPFWPVKGKGCSVRLSEAEGLATALRRVVREAGADAGPSPAKQAPGRRTRRGGSAPSSPETSGGPDRESAPEFDEFGGDGA
jgi:hypothetical protein